MFSKKAIFTATLAASCLFTTTIANAKTLDQNVLAGYLDITATGSALKVDMKEAASDGYNMVIFGFAKVEGVNIAYLSASDENIATKKITEAKNANMKTLISVGGEVNTFNPGKLSKEQIQTLAKNIITFANQRGFDGIDFDLEIPTNAILLRDLTLAIRSEAPNFIISAAPQINNHQLVTSGNNTDYNEAIANNGFDYLFLQAYNTPPQNEGRFIVDSFNAIKTNIPESTKLVIGEPTAAVAAGNITIYHPDANTTLTTDQVTALMRAELPKINRDTKFGGVMGWSLNVDYDAIDYGDANHISGSYAYGLKACVLGNDCATTPTPKPTVANHTLQTTNLSKSFGITIQITDQNGKSFTSDWLSNTSPNNAKLYDNKTNPSVLNLQNLKNLTVKWMTYDKGPSGVCPGTFNFTANTNVMVNADYKSCDIKTMQ